MTGSVRPAPGALAPEPGAAPDPLVVRVENAQHLPFDERSDQIKVWVWAAVVVRAGCPGPPPRLGAGRGQAYSQEIIKTIKEIVQMSPLYRESIHQVMDLGHKYAGDAVFFVHFWWWP